MLALIEHDDALLLERRSDCGRWGLVGGGVGIEESLEDGLRREVREETGLAGRQGETAMAAEGPRIHF